MMSRHEIAWLVRDDDDDDDAASAAKCAVQSQSMSVSRWHMDDDHVGYWYAKPRVGTTVVISSTVHGYER